MVYKRKKYHQGDTHLKKRWRVRNRKKDLDQVDEDLKEENAEKLLNQDIDLDLPGAAQNYCLHCARYFIDEKALNEHFKTKVHKRRLKALELEPYTIEDSERAAGHVKYSALFINGPKATDTYVHITPYIDFPELIKHKEKLQEIIDKRKSTINLNRLEGLWAVYEDLKQRKVELEEKKREAVQELTEKLQSNTNEDHVNKLKIKIHLIKDNLKVLKPPLWAIEEAAITETLRLPNTLHPNTPETEDKVIFAHLTPPTNNKNHIKIGEENELVKFKNNENYYLLGDAAVFELGAKFYIAANFSLPALTFLYGVSGKLLLKPIRARRRTSRAATTQLVIYLQMTLDGVSDVKVTEDYITLVSDCLHVFHSPLNKEGKSTAEGPVCNNLEQISISDIYHRYDDVFEALLLNPKSLHAEVKPKTYQCEICNKCFDNIKRYSGHLRVHTKEDLWRCGTSHRSRYHALSRGPGYAAYVRTASDALRTVVTISRELALISYSNATDLSIRSGSPSVVWNSSLSRQTHRARACSRELGWSMCISECPAEKFSTKRQLLQHIKTHHSAILRQHHCVFCPMAFEISSRLKQHIAAIHFNYRVHKSPEKDPEEIGEGQKIAEYDQHVDANVDDHVKNCYEQNKDTIENGKQANKKPLPKLCGMAFLNKNNLTENSTSIQKPLEQYEKDNRYLERGKSVDKFVNDLLFGNDNNISNNLTMPRSDALNIQETDGLLKDMNQLYSIDDELLYNDIDFDSLNPSQFFNTETDVNLAVNDEIFFDYNESNRSIDQDLMNALCQVKADHLPDELLNVKEKQVNTQTDSCAQATSNCLESTLSVDDCSTIFEKDVDLEASTNLAANLNQLIGGTHDPLLQRHRCKICSAKFSYRSTLNKHVRAAHEPRVARAHTCPLCDKPYKAAWMLKNHLNRNHFDKKPFVCEHEGCEKKFFKHSDLLAHKRTHTGERPYRCEACKVAFPQSTHLHRHRRTVHAKRRKDNDLGVQEEKSTLHHYNENKDDNCGPK
ncbi:Zinc finger protein 593 [Eumeta japonica]|uniref:Zinc finger protein 593 homolog n=1 Tax=Eumeta variegata TaxID=151549 RepID=A0A4C1SF76_EUMVA|nr:Zinc finger protein 593 [Eumeta japonica]